MSQSFDQSGNDAPLNDAGAFAPFLKEARLLVVDDEESLRITTAAIFEREGYIVDTASSGDEAIDLLGKADYDLVLTDLHMEGGDGISVLNRIRQQAPLTISVVLTGFASVESAIAALQEGAYDYLIKPCDIETMKHTVRRGVEHRRLMLAEQKARADLQQLNLDLEQRIEQRTAELKQLNMELADANRAKDVFLATLSHELRTPLNSLLILSDQLSKNPEGNLSPKQTEFAKTIHSSGNDLLMLINDILDLSKIESGTVVVDAGEVRLDNLRSYVERTFRHVAESKSLDFLIRFDQRLPKSMFTDTKRLQQIIKNLLSNAFKFTHHGQVTLNVETVILFPLIRVISIGLGGAGSPSEITIMCR